MNKSLKEILENRNKTRKKMNKIILDLKEKVESINKTQTEGNVAVRNLRTLKGTLEASLTNKIQEKEDSQAIKIQ